MSKESEEFRIACKMHDAIRDRGLEVPENIIRYRDLSYGPDPEWNQLDVYRPRKDEGKLLPVIVSVHGGGWVYGDKELYQFYGMMLAERGFAVVNFSYRLAPEAKFPAGIEDTNAVFAWVLAHKEEYGFDTKRIFALGDSAGANMLGVYANILTNPEFAKEFAFSAPEELSLRAIALNCGKYDMTRRPEEDERLKVFLKEDYLPEGGTKRELSLLNVCEHITAQFPPVFVMTCTGDYLKAQAAILVRALEEREVSFVYHYYARPDDPLWHVFHLNVRGKEAKQCADDECAFFRSCF